MDFAQFWQSFAGKIVELLPASPTLDSDALETIAQYAGYVNYLFPVGKFLAFVAASLVAVAAYYVVMVVLRMIRLIR